MCYNCAQRYAYTRAVLTVEMTVSYSAPDMEAEYCVTSVSVCLSAIIFSELHVDLNKNLCMLPMAVVQSSSGGVVIRYVLPVNG